MLAFGRAAGAAWFVYVYAMLAVVSSNVTTYAVPMHTSSVACASGTDATRVGGADQLT